MAERVGFEPTVRLHAQRFSRPSRSTTLAPLRAAAYTGRNSGLQWRLAALTWRASCVYSALLRRVPEARRALSCLPASWAKDLAKPLGVVVVQAGGLQVRCCHDRRYPHGWKAIHRRC